LRGPEAEAVVVLAGEDGALQASGLEGGGDLGGVEGRGVEGGGGLVAGAPFPVDEGVDGGVEEAAELQCVPAELARGRNRSVGGRGWGRGSNHRHEKGCDAERGQGGSHHRNLFGHGEQVFRGAGPAFGKRGHGGSPLLYPTRRASATATGAAGAEGCW